MAGLGSRPGRLAPETPGHTGPLKLLKSDHITPSRGTTTEVLAPSGLQKNVQTADKAFMLHNPRPRPRPQAGFPPLPSLRLRPSSHPAVTSMPRICSVRFHSGPWLRAPLSVCPSPTRPLKCSSNVSSVREAIQTPSVNMHQPSSISS